MLGVAGALERFKDPEYTGENRCAPCTVMNVLFAGVASTTAVTVTLAAGLERVAPLLGAGLLVASLAAIYFKGYLVPGTPTLTKRYLPERALAAFGKEPESGVAGATVEGTDDEAEEVDVESVLVGADVLTEREDGRDLRLTEEFEAAFHETLEDVRETSATTERLLDALGVGRGEISVSEHGEAFRVRKDGHLVGTWESKPAFLADVAAAELLGDRLANWERTPVRQRGQLLNGLRLFLTTCPGCGGALSFGTETVESCCSTREVVAVTCDACGARVFEATDVA